MNIKKIFSNFEQIDDEELKKKYYTDNIGILNKFTN